MARGETAQKMTVRLLAKIFRAHLSASALLCLADERLEMA